MIHLLDKEFDMGSILATISHTVNYDKIQSIDDNIQRLRDKITPLFSKLAQKAIGELYSKN